MNTVKILGKDFELFWSAQAMHEITDKCGKLDNLDKYIFGKDSSDVAGIYTRFTEVLEILVNAAIKRDNYAIDHGFKQGEKKSTFAAGDLSVIVGLGELEGMVKGMKVALNSDMEYEIPEGAKIEKKEVDETLEEIKENRRKKEESGE